MRAAIAGLKQLSPRRIVVGEIIPGATHPFEEPGALEQVAALASAWFEAHLRARAAQPMQRARHG
jgi:hypothetical protein